MAATVIAETAFTWRFLQTELYVAASILVFAGLIFAWFISDARERNVQPSTGLKIAIVAIALVAAPYYKFRYFGARSGFVFLAITIGLVLGVAALELITIELLRRGVSA